MFSFRNHDDIEPFKAPLRDPNNPQAINCDPDNCPTFGSGPDLKITSNANQIAHSMARIGQIYQPPPGYDLGLAKTESLLAGGLYFIPVEVEVLYLQ